MGAQLTFGFFLQIQKPQRCLMTRPLLILEAPQPPFWRRKVEPRKPQVGFSAPESLSDPGPVPCPLLKLLLEGPFHGQCGWHPELPLPAFLCPGRTSPAVMQPPPGMSLPPADIGPPPYEPPGHPVPQPGFIPPHVNADGTYMPPGKLGRDSLGSSGVCLAQWGCYPAFAAGSLVFCGGYCWGRGTDCGHGWWTWEGITEPGATVKALWMSQMSQSSPGPCQEGRHVGRLLREL